MSEHFDNTAGQPGSPHGWNPGAAAPAHDQAQPWQDQSGQWHYPYDAQPQVWQPSPDAPPAEPAYQLAAHASQHQQVFVPAAALQPIAPPQHARPMTPVRDPQRTALAAVIAFIAVVIGLWAVLGYVHSMTTTLSSVASGNDKLAGQLTTANAGLAQLRTKTGVVPAMGANSKTLRIQLEGINKDMNAMLAGVDTIGTEMTSMNGSLTTLDSELAKVNEINADMATDLGDINAGLGQQQDQVTAMRRDIVATSRQLKGLSGKLRGVNGRLGHINSVVCFMGSKGILNNLKVHIKVPLIGEIGSAEVFATVVPPGSWRC